MSLGAPVSFTLPLKLKARSPFTAENQTQYLFWERWNHTTLADRFVTLRHPNRGSPNEAVAGLLPDITRMVGAFRRLDA